MAGKPSLADENGQCQSKSFTDRRACTHYHREVRSQECRYFHAGLCLYAPREHLLSIKSYHKG